MVLLWIALWVSPARAGTVTIELGAKITAVELKAQRVTINRGEQAGIKVGSVGEIYLMRETVEFNERVARGKVVSVKPGSAVVAIEAVIDTVEVGAFFLYNAAVDEQLAKSPLFRIVALGVELRGIETNDPILTTEQMLADPSPALRDKALDKVLAEMRTHRDVIDSVGRRASSSTVTTAPPR